MRAIAQQKKSSIKDIARQDGGEVRERMKHMLPINIIVIKFCLTWILHMHVIVVYLAQVDILQTIEKICDRESHMLSADLL